MKLPLNKINIGQRQRIDLGDLSDLESMADKDIGLILPIIVHKTLTGYELVDGRRRLEKATQLGWAEVEVTEKDLLTPVQKQKMELLADIGRKNRTWQEVCVSLYKIDGMLKLEKAATGERWTVRAMANFSGFSKSRVAEFLNVGERLLAVPKDEEMWASEGITEAVKLQLARQVKETQREMEERRQRANQLEAGFVENHYEFPSSNAEGLVQKTDKTSNEKLVIKICGTNMDFKDAVLDRDFVPALAVLGYNCQPTHADNIYSALKDDCLAVLWNDNLDKVVSSYSDYLSEMPWRLVWNKVAVLPFAKPYYPFVCNYASGEVLCKTMKYNKINDHHYTSTFSCTPDDSGDLPAEIVAWTLEAICPPNMPVLCINNAPVVTVAQTGRIPIFFEADKEKFEKKCLALKQWYEENIPNVEVRMP